MNTNSIFPEFKSFKKTLVLLILILTSQMVYCSINNKSKFYTIENLKSEAGLRTSANSNFYRTGISWSESTFQASDSLAVCSRKIDSILVKLFYFQQEKKYDQIHQSIASITEILKPIEKTERFFCGIIQLHQAFYAGNSKLSKPFIDKALVNLANSKTRLADDMSKQFYWLINEFYLEQRQSEWEPVDQFYRAALKPSTMNADVQSAIANYAILKLSKKEYEVVNNLAKYDEIYFSNQASDQVNNKIAVFYAQWLQLKQRLAQWLEIPYESRSKTQFHFNQGQVVPDFLDKKEDYTELINYNYKGSFISLLKAMEKIRSAAIIENKRSSPNYKESNRQNYYAIYSNFLQDFFIWSINDNKQSEAILPIKKFLYEDVIDQEIPDALKAGKKTVVTAESITNLYKNLSKLYYDLGMQNKQAMK